jgi:hypothetical protein
LLWKVENFMSVSLEKIDRSYKSSKIFQIFTCKQNETVMCQGKGETIDGFIDLSCTRVLYLADTMQFVLGPVGLQEKEGAAKRHEIQMSCLAYFSKHCSVTKMTLIFHN